MKKFETLHFLRVQKNMSDYLVKIGSCSILLGKGHYGNYFPIKENKLLKVTKIIQKHNEFTILDKVRKIKNYSEYYSIPDDIFKTISNKDLFYNYVKDLVKYESINIFDDILNCCYIENCGEIDIQESMVEIFNYNDCTLWSSYKFIIEFSRKILQGLSYLHQNKICHLDIKPENIVINKYLKRFKIIDFGFSSLEPFDDYLENLKGTPGYFPKSFPNEKVTEWLPKIKANDFAFVNGKIKLEKDRSLVYKIDSYCLGRVLYFIKFIYKKNKKYTCFNYERKSELRLDNIISSLLENDSYNRVTATRCLQIYY